MVIDDIIGKDCYVRHTQLFEKYRSFETTDEEVIDFNHASLARPYRAVHAAIQKNRKAPVKKARASAGSLVNLADTSRVLFARNTTEALSLTYWLANADAGNVVATDAENPSVLRIYLEHRDHANTNKSDGWSTYPDEVIAEKYLCKTTITPAQTTLRIANFLNTKSIDSIIDQIDENTRLAIISHVLRTSGEIIDVSRIAKSIKRKNPDTYIAIDGAQALGAIPQVDFFKLEQAGVDFYAATPHKTLGSYPMGILYVGEKAAKNMSLLRNVPAETQHILQGMIPKTYGILGNVPAKLNSLRYTSIVAATQHLQKEGFLIDNDFTEKAAYTTKLKSKFIQKLNRRGINIDNTNQSSAILAYRIPGEDNAAVVEQLQQQGIFCSYISQTNTIRVSFDITNKPQEIERYFVVLDAVR